MAYTARGGCRCGGEWGRLQRDGNVGRKNIAKTPEYYVHHRARKWGLYLQCDSSGRGRISRPESRTSQRCVFGTALAGPPGTAR